LAFKPEDRAVDVGLFNSTGIVYQIARGEVIGAIDHNVIGFYKVWAFSEVSRFQKIHLTVGINLKRDF